jgi:hypothetical protein
MSSGSSSSTLSSFTASLVKGKIAEPSLWKSRFQQQSSIKDIITEIDSVEKQYGMLSKASLPAYATDQPAGDNVNEKQLPLTNILDWPADSSDEDIDAVVLRQPDVTVS